MYKHLIAFLLMINSFLLILSQDLSALDTRPDELFLGKVFINKANLKLDSKSKRELDNIILKLKIMPEHMIIKVHGDAGIAKTTDKHYYNSLFISREVVEYLTKKLGPNRDILVSAEMSTNNKLGSSVSIFLVPSLLKLEKISDRFSSLNKQNQQHDMDIQEPAESEDYQASETVKDEKTPEELAAEKKFEELRQAEEMQMVEEIRKADDLVAKEKLRAIEREKKLRQAQ